MIVEESKDRYIRILEYKYLKVCMVLEVKNQFKFGEIQLFINFSLPIVIDGKITVRLSDRL